MGFLEVLMGMDRGAGYTAPGMPTGPPVGRPGGGGGPSGPVRRPRPDYNPQEQAGWDIIAKHAAAGASPDLLMSMASDLQTGLDERTAAWQAKNQMRQERMAQIPTMLGTAAELQAAGLPQGAVDAAFSGLGGPVERRLDEAVGGLYGGEGAAGGLPEEEKLGIATKASEAAAAGTPLHQARMAMMSEARALGADEQQLRDTYNLIGQIYSGAVPTPLAGEPGGSRAAQLNAPLTYSSYLEQLRAPPEPPPEPGGGLLNLLPNFIRGR